MKTKAEKKYQSVLEKKAKIGKQMNTKRKEIRSKLVEKKQMEVEPLDKELSSTADLLNQRKRKKIAKQMTNEIDELTEELQELHDQAEKLNDDIDQHKSELFKEYVSKCEELQKNLFKKIDEAEKINDELKTIEGEHWELLSLAHAGFRRPYLPQWKQTSGWVKQNQNNWKRMKDTKLKQN